MDDYCNDLHELLNNLPRLSFPFKEDEIPLNGIYILFEKGERAHGGYRIVRVGTHTGDNQLRSRLQQHFLMENKDRSIFRKNIGRAILNRAKDPFLQQWNYDLTTRQAKDKFGKSIDRDKLRRVELQVSKYIRNSFSFAVFRIDSKDKRLRIESKMISTISRCNICQPSPGWLGFHSPLEKIRKSGLWLVNELYKEPLSIQDFEEMKALI
jgi:hypothetical protein